MKIEQVQELLRTARRFPLIYSIEVLARADVVWDATRGRVLRTQIGRCSYSVAVIDADHLEVLCLDRDGRTDVVSITRHEAAMARHRSRSSG